MAAPESRRRTSGRPAAKTWLCGICTREIAQPHMKRHLQAHDRHGTPRERTDAEWLAFLDVVQGRRDV